VKRDMSRIGKQPIVIPEGVSISNGIGNITVQGPKGELQVRIPRGIALRRDGSSLCVVLEKDARGVNNLWGLTRVLIANAVKGVTEGYEKRLQLEGVGYRALLEGNNLVLSVGYSHPVRFIQPEGIAFSLEKNTIIIRGIDKQRVGAAAAAIRKIRPPEPYKGSGIRYADEVVRRKAGKKAASAG